MRASYFLCFSLFSLFLFSISNAATWHWSNVVVGGGGFITGIVYNPSEQNLLYVRTDIGGLYRGNSAGTSWTPLTDIFNETTGNYLGIESLATDPKETNRLYYAGGLYTASWNGNGAIFASTDKGNTWKTRWSAPFKMGSNEDGRSAGERLAVNPVSNNIVYYGSQSNGLWRSTNYGADFSQVTSLAVPSNSNGGRGVALVVFDPHDKTGQTFIVGVDVLTNSLYRTTDGGSHFQAIAGQPSGFFPHHVAFSSDGTNMYVTYSNGPGPNGITNGAVYKYTTSSGAWKDISPFAPGKNGQPNFGYTGLALDKADPNVIVVATMDRWYPIDDLYRSTDGGQTWKSVSSTSKVDISNYPYLNFGNGDPKFGWWMGTVAIDPFNSGRVLYGTGATIYGTDNIKATTITFTPRVAGLEETAVLDLASPPSGPSLYSAFGDIGGFTHNDVTVSPKQGMWTNPIFGNGISVNFAESVPAAVVRVGVGSGSPAQNGAISWDSGRSWTPFHSEPTSQNGGVVVLSADAKTIVWTPSQRQPYWSSNNGSSWTLCQGIANSYPVIADRVSPTTFYALDSSSTTVYRSDDSGRTFKVTGTFNADQGKGLAASYGAKGDLWMVSGNGLFHSVDGGGTFSKIAGVTSTEAIGFGRPQTTGQPPAIYFSGVVNNVYGIYGSFDNAKTFQHLNDANHQWGWLGQKVIGDPKVYGRVYVATNGRGIVMGNLS